MPLPEALEKVHQSIIDRALIANADILEAATIALENDARRVTPILMFTPKEGGLFYAGLPDVLNGVSELCTLTPNPYSQDPRRGSALTKITPTLINFATDMYSHRMLSGEVLPFRLIWTKLKEDQYMSVINIAIGFVPRPGGSEAIQALCRWIACGCEKWDGKYNSPQLISNRVESVVLTCFEPFYAHEKPPMSFSDILSANVYEKLEGIYDM